MMKSMPDKNGQTIQNDFCRNFGEIMRPLLAYSPAIRQINDILRNAMTRDMDNKVHYNELNDVVCLPPLIPDEGNDSHELPSIQDISDTCNDDEHYELPSLVVDDDTY